MKKLTMHHKLLLVLWIGLLVGCGSTGVKDSVDSAAAEPQLMDTIPFIPVQEYDEKTSAFLPYIARGNPYLALKGRINKHAVTKFIQARRLYKTKDFQQVEVIIDEIVEIDKKLSGPWVIRADIAVEQERLENAIQSYQKAIEINSSNINAYIKLAKTQRVSGRFIEAQNTYADALSIWPDFPEAHLNLGILYDLYLNHPLRAQRHMQAYQFLTDGKNQQVSAWIAEIQNRTGVKTTLTKQ